MLAYRHAFHAGNHADVLKHLVLVQVLRYMALKDKPFTLVDTHAGAGGYSLEGRYAQTKAEYEQGIARLWSRDDLPPPLADYVALVRKFNGGDGLEPHAAQVAFEQYPGSPAFAHLLLRPQDRLRLYELHSTDHRILAAYLGTQANTQVTQGDGFAALKAELPPPSRPDKPLSVKTLIIPTQEYSEGRNVILTTGRSVYTVALRHLVEQRAEWSWAAIQIVEKRSRV